MPRTWLLFLGIESTCDETAASVVCRPGGDVRSNNCRDAGGTARQISPGVVAGDRQPGAYREHFAGGSGSGWRRPARGCRMSMRSPSHIGRGLVGSLLIGRDGGQDAGVGIGQAVDRLWITFHAQFVQREAGDEPGAADAGGGDGVCSGGHTAFVCE